MKPASVAWQSCCKLATEHINTSRSKHIPLRYHIVKEQVMKEKNFQVYWCPTDWQLADMFTKSLTVKKFEDMDLYIRGYKDRKFEDHCQLIEPGVWSSQLLTCTANKNICSKCQMNTMRNIAALRPIKAEGECRIMQHDREGKRQHSRFHGVQSDSSPREISDSSVSCFPLGETSVFRPNAVTARQLCT